MSGSTALSALFTTQPEYMFPEQSYHTKRQHLLTQTTRNPSTNHPMSIFP